MTIAIGILLAIPSWTKGVRVPVLAAIWLACGYQAMIFLVAAVSVGWMFNRRRWVAVLFALLFLLNFGPELAAAIEFSITGGSSVLSQWMNDKGIDYDPPFFVPLHFELNN
ncbi:MAG: hypothetical protein ACR2NZ_15275 [Rubripirellula sp.]